jgi:hypothetical protein
LQVTVVVTGGPPVGVNVDTHEVALMLTDSVGISLEPESWTEVMEALFSFRT